ncbi:hypothetical protein M1N56_06455 [Dehalococcoidia bacterium]|nr:hypothetical protein [Dehalococcoidia bacterium]
MGNPDKLGLMSDLKQLADLLSSRNSIDVEIGAIIGRPAITGHIGEYIAAEIFDIGLSQSASEKSLDGYFQSGSLAGSSVNIKYYTVRGSILDITPDSLPDYYLVMMGSSVSSDSSRDMVYPADIASVHIFESSSLMAALRNRGVKIGVATSVVRHLWDSAEVYPHQTNEDFIISGNQADMLAQFQ